MAIVRNYQELINDAMLGVLRSILQQVEVAGLQGENHLYISFLTKNPDVVLSNRMKHNYPEEMTIVLQHQFDDLIVKDDYFSLGLSFHGIHEIVKIPFCAVTSFIEPSVKLSYILNKSATNTSKTTDIKKNNSDIEKSADIKDQNAPNIDIIEGGAHTMGQVIVLDKFRKKDNFS